MEEVVGKGFSDPRESASICVLNLDLNADLRGLTRMEEVVGKGFSDLRRAASIGVLHLGLNALFVGECGRGRIGGSG